MKRASKAVPANLGLKPGIRIRMVDAVRYIGPWLTDEDDATVFTVHIQRGQLERLADPSASRRSTTRRTRSSRSRQNLEAVRQEHIATCNQCVVEAEHC
jgi:hypothetical protein